MNDFRHRIERDAELALHELGDGILVCLNAVVGIAAIFELVDFALKRFAYNGRGHVVVFADAEIQELAFRMSSQCRPFGSFDLLELVDLGAFAVIRAAHALGEHRLKPGIGRSIGHCNVLRNGKIRLSSLFYRPCE